MEVEGENTSHDLETGSSINIYILKNKVGYRNYDMHLIALSVDSI